MPIAVKYDLVLKSLIEIPSLIFSAESDFAGSRTKYKTMVVLQNNGENIWMSPATFKSSCGFDVSYFPFDNQLCELTFGSWTFTTDKMRLEPMSRFNHFAGSQKLRVISDH